MDADEFFDQSISNPFYLLYPWADQIYREGSLSIEQRDRGIDLLGRRHRAMRHPAIDEALDVVEQDLPWAMTVLGGPWHWFLDDNRCHQMGRSLTAIEAQLLAWSDRFGDPAGYGADEILSPFDGLVRWMTVRVEVDPTAAADPERARSLLTRAIATASRVYAVVEDPRRNECIDAMRTEERWAWFVPGELEGDVFTLRTKHFLVEEALDDLDAALATAERFLGLVGGSAG